MIQQLLIQALHLALKKRLVVLCFHRVLLESDPLQPSEPDVKSFREFIRLLSSHFNIMNIGDAVDRINAGEFPGNTICLSFDDGYRDNHSLAMPILIEHGITASFCITSEFIGKSATFYERIIESVRHSCGTSLDLRELGLGTYPLGTTADKVDAINQISNTIKYFVVSKREKLSHDLLSLTGATTPPDQMLSAEKICDMKAKGMELCTHTAHHPILSTLPDDEVDGEIQQGKRALEEIIGETVDVFGIPNGKSGIDYSRKHIDAIRKMGFKAGLSSEWGSVGIDSDCLQLPRISAQANNINRSLLWILQACLSKHQKTAA